MMDADFNLGEALHGEPSDRLLPEINISNRFMRDITQESIEALKLQNGTDPTIFTFGSNIVRFNKYDYRIEPLNLASCRGLLDRSAKFFKMSQGMPVPARPPEDVCKDILSLPVHDLSLPILNGISKVPVFLPDGRLLCKSGFDADSGLYLRIRDLNNLKIDTTIKDALTLIRDEMLGDFPFADESSMAHAIAALLLSFVRSMIDGPTPLHLIEASLRGTGKGLLADVISWICLGIASEPMAFPKSEEEIEKRILSALISGSPIALIDNIYQLKSPAFCIALTTEKYRGRILGKSELQTIPNKSLWLGTGNNIELSDEIVRRSVSIRLDSNSARPEERNNFKHSNLVQWIRHNRSEIISSCLSIVQHWINAGMPKVSATLGRFESWAGIMGGILDTAGVPGFLEDRDRLHSQNDQESTEWAVVVELWHERYGERAVTSKDILTILKEHELLLDIWAGKSALSGQQRLGHIMPTKRDRVFKSGVSGVSGVKIISAGQDSRTGNSAYRLSLIYIISSTQQLKKTPETPETLEPRINKGCEGTAISGVGGVFQVFSDKTPHCEDNIPFFDEEIQL